MYVLVSARRWALDDFPIRQLVVGAFVPACFWQERTARIKAATQIRAIFHLTAVQDHLASSLARAKVAGVHRLFTLLVGVCG